jgi:hypothetical protein
VLVVARTGTDRTVLMRRLVEECALKSVSAIVLDTDGSMVRLGDLWPSAPPAWEPADGPTAQDYLDSVDVVVWTPGLEYGRPLAFAPLPDFEAVRADPDEFRAAVDMAVGGLAPHAIVDSLAGKSHQALAVLRDALSYFARQGETGGLRAFVAVLAELPDGVTQVGQGSRIAAELAAALSAAMVNYPFLGDTANVLDPGLLLVPASGKGARISVISTVGLRSDEQRYGFVHQLQNALFTWIRHHPAAPGQLRGLVVADEAHLLAPASGTTACAASTLALIAQARAHGLGLVFATDQPRSLHQQIRAAAATHIVGTLETPAQLGAATEVAATQAGGTLELNTLTPGGYYASVAGRAFQEMRALPCLTHISTTPFTPEEIIDRARPA